MSRGISIRDFDPNPKPKSYPNSMAEMNKPVFAIKVGNQYYYDRSPTNWTYNVIQASRYFDRSVPDGIVAYWNKVHYDQIIKGVRQQSSLNGVKVLNTAEVVDISSLIIPVSDLWEQYEPK